VKYGTDGDSLYPVTRLLLPYLDRERGTYGIKESVLADLYVDFLKLGKGSSDAQKLKNYRAPKRNAGDAGDFAAVLQTVLQHRHYGNSDSNSDSETLIKVAQVNALLDEIVAVNANEGRRGVQRILMILFQKMSDVQQKWLVSQGCRRETVGTKLCR
jgi:DNA ligase-4